MTFFSCTPRDGKLTMNIKTGASLQFEKLNYLDDGCRRAARLEAGPKV